MRELSHHAHFTGNVDDFRWRDCAVLWMIPAQQSLETNHTPAGKFDHRLEVSLYLSGFDRDTQITLDALFTLPLMLKALLEK